MGDKVPNVPDPVVPTTQTEKPILPRLRSPIVIRLIPLAWGLVAAFLSQRIGVPNDAASGALLVGGPIFVGCLLLTIDLFFTSERGWHLWNLTLTIGACIIPLLYAFANEALGHVRQPCDIILLSTFTLYTIAWSTRRPGIWQTAALPYAVGNLAAVSIALYDLYAWSVDKPGDYSVALVVVACHLAVVSLDIATSRIHVRRWADGPLDNGRTRRGNRPLRVLVMKSILQVLFSVLFAVMAFGARGRHQLPGTPEETVDKFFEAAMKGEPLSYLRLTTGELRSSLEKELGQYGVGGFRERLYRSSESTGATTGVSRSADARSGRVVMDRTIFTDQGAERQRLLLAQERGGWAVTSIEVSADATVEAIPYGTPVFEE